MKTMLTTILITVFVGVNLASNYEETMAKNINKIDQSGTTSELVNLANEFQRIANVEKDKWMPGYYAAYCYTRVTTMGRMDKDEVHKYLDLAQAEINKRLKFTTTESEIYALQALVYQLRITDMSKGYKYSSLSNEALMVAEKLDPENPRVYYLKGSNTFHTPKMFGGGAKKAKPDLEKAAKLFNTKETANKLAPGWGGVHNSKLLSQCMSKE